MNRFIVIWIWFATSYAIAGPMIDSAGHYHSDAPSALSTPTSLVQSPTMDDLNAAGWRVATQAEINAYENARAQAAIEAEAAKIAGKDEALKKAENKFLLILSAFNSDNPEHAITQSDGYEQIEEKIEATGLNDIQKLRISAKLRNAWDVVIFHGGRFGDVQYHPEVAE